MSTARPLNLSAADVATLKKPGLQSFTLQRELRPQPEPGELPAENPFRVGERLSGRERVARRHRDDAVGQWLYLADGYVTGRFYTQNYHMPKEACRFQLEVVASELEYTGSVWLVVFSVRLVPAEAPVAPVATMLYLLDFDQVAEAGFRTRHRPTFPVAMLKHATDATAEKCALVRTYAREHHQALWLPLVSREVRHWLRSLRFTKNPTVQVGGIDVECGKEVAAI